MTSIPNATQLPGSLQQPIFLPIPTRQGKSQAYSEMYWLAVHKAAMSTTRNSLRAPAADNTEPEPSAQIPSYLTSLLSRI
jgi:hypothetical protein